MKFCEVECRRLNKKNRPNERSAPQINFVPASFASALTMRATFEVRLVLTTIKH